MARTLSETRFIALSHEINQLLEAAQGAAATDKARGYWSIGQRIERERLSEEAGYHNSVLRDLARTTHLSIRTLQRSVAFHAAYEEVPDARLTWGHYQILSSIESKKERRFYEREAEKGAWSVSQLRDALRFGLFHGGEPEEATLERPTSPSYTYLARLERVVDGDTLDLDVDLGFETWTKRRVRLCDIDCPESSTREGRAARNFVVRHLASAKTLAIKSQKSDLYGRYLADVFFTSQKSSLEDCFHQGRHLGELLIRSGHARML